MNKHLYIVLICLTLFSCRKVHDNRDVPKDLIPKDEMVVVITELVKLEAYVKMQYPSVTQFHKAIINSSDSLFKSHGTNHEAFDASMDYYGMDQVEMKKIYSEALNQLNHELGELQSQD